MFALFKIDSFFYAIFSVGKIIFKMPLIILQFVNASAENDVELVYPFQKKQEGYAMLYCKLNQIRNLAQEIDRLERLRTQVEKSRKPEYKTGFYENLKACKDLYLELTQEDLLKNLNLSEEEKKIARLYFYKGMEWRYAMCDSLDDKMLKKILDDTSGKLEARALSTLKKQITRTVQVYYDFQKSPQT